MAVKIAYKNMSSEQKKLAEKVARKWGIPAERVTMTKSGLITIHRKDVPHLSSVDYNLIREGLHYDEITDAHREDYLESLNDVPSKEEMQHVKQTFASLR